MPPSCSPPLHCHAPSVRPFTSHVWTQIPLSSPSLSLCASALWFKPFAAKFTSSGVQTFPKHFLAAVLCSAVPFSVPLAQPPGLLLEGPFTSSSISAVCPHAPTPKTGCVCRAQTAGMGKCGAHEDLPHWRAPVPETSRLLPLAGQFCGVIIQIPDLADMPGVSLSCHSLAADPGCCSLQTPTSFVWSYLGQVVCACGPRCDILIYKHTMK